MSKPKITTNCVANRYARHDERIVEVSDGVTDKGCLISIHRDGGRLIVSVYKCDDGVLVVAQKGHLAV